MNIEAKLDDLAKQLNASDSPNKQALLIGYQSLKAFLNCSLSLKLLKQAYSALKRNPFSEQFGLAEDLLKIYEDKVDSAKRTDTAIEALLSNLEEDLNKEAGLDEDPEDDISEVFFEDLDKLKSLFSCKVVTANDMEWFLHSDLFCLISESVACFTVALEDIYKALLRNVKTGEAEYFMEHKKILIEKANMAMENKEAFDRRAFFLILNAKKNDFRLKLGTANHLNRNTLFKAKARKTATFSPVAKRAMFNYLRQSQLSINKQEAIISL